MFFAFPGSLIRIFLDDPEVVLHGGKLLRNMCAGILFQAVDFLAVAVFQAVGKGSYSLVFAVLRKVVLEIPALIVFNKIYPLYGMGFAPPFAEFALCVAALCMLKKICYEKEK